MLESAYKSYNALMRRKVIYGAITLAVLGLLGANSGRLLDASATPAATQQGFQFKEAPEGSLSLITEPGAGIAPVLDMIENASTSIDLVMYQLEDTDVEQALADASARGVQVRVLLNEGYYGAAAKDNSDAYNFLTAHAVPVEWTPATFALTHQKTLVTDDKEALIMTFNFTPQYYSSSRDFGIIDTDLADVAAIEQTFNADWQDVPIDAPQGDDLLWSPGSEPETLALINAATSTLQIYNEEMADGAVTSALEAAAERGVRVEVLMTYATDWKDSFQALKAAGVLVRTYAATAPLYIHAKMILADNATAFVGSENFSSSSLDHNRELGLVLEDPGVINQLNAQFTQDWAGARPY